MLRALRHRWMDSLESSRLARRNSRKPARAGIKRLQHQARFEPLEERQLLAITVNNPAGAETGSLVFDVTRSGASCS